MASKDFISKYTEIKNEKRTLNFQIGGNEKYGLNKTIVNGIRRTLLTDIKTIAFNPEDIIIDTNTGSLHNEFIKHRISLIPLYIDPENYYRNLLFELKIKIDDDQFKNVYNNDFNIYPLKIEYQKLIDEQNEMDFIPDDSNIFTKLQTISKDYYDLLNPLSNSEKKKIFRPFEFPKNNFNHFLLTELKQTGSDKDIQELDLYCVPSIGTSREHARFNNLPTIVYSYTKDKKAFEKYLADQIKIEKPKDPVSFSRSLRLRDSERYHMRDNMNEPYVYDFTITSNHYYDSKSVYIKSIDILIERFEFIILHSQLMIEKPDESLFSYDKFKNDTTYQIIMGKQDDTTGNMIQSHMVNKIIDKDSFIQICGYKKPHPLTDLIIFNVMIQPGGDTELQKKSTIVKTFIDTCKDLIDLLDIMKNEGSKKLH